MSLTRKLLGPAAIATALLGWSAASHAVCIPANFPVNWLQQQENAGGHTIARHVDKTDQQLAQRLANDPNIQEASSYRTAMANPQATITAGLASNRNAINTWAANAANGQRRAYDYVAGADVGRVASRNPAAPPPALYANTCTFRAVLRATGGGNCYLLTSYPTTPDPGDCP